jgi:hypothetical protein
VDKTSKKTKEQMKSSATEAAEILGISEETTQGIIKSVVEAAEKSKEAAAGAKSTEETAKAATTEVKKTGEEAAKTAEATKKIVDIKATEGNIKAIKDVLENYRSALKSTSEKVLKDYDEELKAAGDNAEKRKEIEARKTQAIKEFTEQIWTLNQKKNELEKKEQDLGLLQWQQYAEKFSGVTKSVNSLVQQMGTSIKGIFSTITAGIDEEIKEIDDKTKEVDIILAESNARKNDLEAEQSARKKEITEHNKGLAKEDVNYIIESEDEKIQKLTELIEKESIINKQQTAEKNRLDAEKKKKEQEKRKLEKTQRKIDLGMQITSGIANVAEGVTKALAKGPIIGQILAAIQAAQGAVQVAIMTNQLRKLEDGGLLRGKRHSQGGMRIEGTNMEVEGGEFVVNRISTDKNLGLVKYINEQRRELKPNDLNTFFSRSSQGLQPTFKSMLADGGQLPVIEPTNNIDNESLIQAIKSIKIESKVAVTDIHKVEDNMTSVSGWSGA